MNFLAGRTRTFTFQSTFFLGVHYLAKVFLAVSSLFIKRFADLIFLLALRTLDRLLGDLSALRGTN